MKQGVYPEMSEKEYRQAEGLNYSALGAFNQSQDHALMTVEPKSFFEFGNAFEMCLQDHAKGTSLFTDNFFVCDAPGTMPEKLAGIIQSGEDLTTHYVYTKKGDRNDRHKKLHTWLDCCSENPGKMPMSDFEFHVLTKMVQNLLKTEVEYIDGVDDQNEPLISSFQVEDLMKAADFQAPIFWEKDGIKKKALFDMVINTGMNTYIFDIKSSANMPGFMKMFRSKYWIQDIHYSEGAQHVFNDTKPMRFLTAFKEDPYLGQSFVCNHESRGIALLEYDKLCDQYNEWELNGKPTKGWKKQRSIKLYFGD